MSFTGEYNDLAQTFGPSLVTARRGTVQQIPTLTNLWKLHVHSENTTRCKLQKKNLCDKSHVD